MHGTIQMTMTLHSGKVINLSKNEYEELIELILEEEAAEKEAAERQSKADTQDSINDLRKKIVKEADKYKRDEIYKKHKQHPFDSPPMNWPEHYDTSAF